MAEIPSSVPPPPAGTPDEPPLALLAADGPPPSVPYVNPSHARSRPGLVTAIGVISIVVGCISAIASLMFGGQAFLLFMFAKMGSAMSNASTVTVTNGGTTTVMTTVNATAGSAPSPAAAAAPSTAPSGPNELPAAERSAVMTALTGLQPLSVERDSELQAMLTLHGRELFPDNGSALSVDSVRQMIKQKPSESKAGGGAEGSTWYVIPTGRITLFDDRAVFASVDGTSSFETHAVDLIAPDSSTAVTTTTLTPPQVSAIVARVRAWLPGINSSQVATLQRELSAANQQFIDPKLIWSPVQSVVALPDGTVTIQFTGNAFAAQGGGMMRINSQGQMTSQAAATIGPAGAATPQFPFAHLNISRWKIVLAIVEDALSIGVAIFLFVLGILTFRQSLSSRRLHLLYAWLKIPLGIVGGIAVAWVYSTFFGGVGAGQGAGFPASNLSFIYAGIWIGLIACIYPVALIIALNTRYLREYYGVESAK